ncbi:MAG: transporter [Flavobacterium sp. BFFFF1]|uniref:OmpP1/FadL family transporter n=1 Tax=Flavobacterium sp. BFFFF1 TaxID=2015557 RepID=UPI000BD0D2CD|nr:outer membrane protein transport protein [Flavobacterium sp. BFFFF1]OYU82093.1 MAG: transporter [Flavobacterium sp. BFFFF1]
MKKYLSILILGLAAVSTQAQDATDGLRYAQDNLNGTARFRAMGGAFGALGGDFSSLNVNPAGSAIFTNNQAALTLSSVNTTNRSNYFGEKYNENDNTFDLNQVGGIWIFKDTSEKTGWNKIALGLNYENANLFDNSVFYRGHNGNSVANYFTSYANGIPLSTITGNNFEDLYYNEQQAYLGYEGFIINPGAGNTYTSNVTGANNFYQENTIVSTGYNGKLSFNAAVSYKDKYYIGLNLNSHFTDFNRHTSFYEDYQDAPGHNNNAGLQALRFSNDLTTYGSGFSFQLGGIAKLTKEFRVGLAYESPTWYSLKDELLQTLAVRTAEQGDFYADPDIKIIYPTYKLQTPSRYTGSLAYVFGTKGLISVDYSMKDYSNTRFKPKAEFTTANAQMADLFDTSGELRVGGEYKVKKWSFRGGYRFEKSPYKNDAVMSDLNAYSAGLGYSFGDTKIDVSYTKARRDYQQSSFSQGLTDSATINQRNHNVSLTVIFEL